MSPLLPNARIRNGVSESLTGGPGHDHLALSRYPATCSRIAGCQHDAATNRACGRSGCRAGWFRANLRERWLSLKLEATLSRAFRAGWPPHGPCWLELFFGYLSPAFPEGAAQLNEPNYTAG